MAPPSTRPVLQLPGVKWRSEDPLRKADFKFSTLETPETKGMLPPCTGGPPSLAILSALSLAGAQSQAAMCSEDTGRINALMTQYQAQQYS